MASLQQRITGVFTLDGATFEEIEHDNSSTSQAAVVLVVASAASSIGLFWAGGLQMIVSGVVMALLGWFAGGGLIWLVGTRVLPARRTEADLGQVLRVLGYAQAPRLLLVVVALPVAGPVLTVVVFSVVLIWTLAAMVIGVRQALDYESVVHAALVCILALAVMSALFWLAGWALAPQTVFSGH
jgi:hypothetical protein